MRIITSIGFGLVALTSLAACGKSDEAVRTEARTRLVANCPRSATPEVTAMLTQEGLTVDQVCSCAIERYMSSATVAQIREDSAVATPARISTASTQCVAELIAAHQANATTAAHDGAPAANEAGRADGTAETGGEAANAAH